MGEAGPCVKISYRFRSIHFRGSSYDLSALRRIAHNEEEPQRFLRYASSLCMTCIVYCGLCPGSPMSCRLDHGSGSI